MGSMGGKGGQSQEASIPQWAEDASVRNIDQAEQLASVGYMPWMGADVAALTPMQEQGMQNTANQASAFGLAPDGMDAMAGMPESQEYVGGVQGYGSFDGYLRNLNEMQKYAPEQMRQYRTMFTDAGEPLVGSRYDNGMGLTDEEFLAKNRGGGPPPTPQELRDIIAARETPQMQPQQAGGFDLQRMQQMMGQQQQPQQQQPQQQAPQQSQGLMDMMRRSNG